MKARTEGFRKLLAVLLTFSMVWSLIPTSALAEGLEEVADLAAQSEVADASTDPDEAAAPESAEESSAGEIGRGGQS